MQPVTDDVPRMSNEGLALLLGNRLYGDDREADHLGALRKMPVPPGMEALRGAIEQQSKLLFLPEDGAPEAIYDAFGQDLQLLVRYRDAFKQTVDAAVRARAASSDDEAQAFLDRVVAQISEVVFEPTLDLGPNALRLEPDALRRQLQEQFRADAAMLVGSLAVWLHVLAESEFVSVIEWLNPRAVRYHFFHMATDRQELDRKRSVSGDVFTGRTVTTTTRTQLELFSERRVHTVVNASVNALEAYRRRVPQRIARLIDTIPAEVRPFLSIIDGTVSHEEVHRRLTQSRVETTTRAVFIPDPALALFDTWAINGWGGSTDERIGSVYRGHPLSKANGVLIAEIVGAFVMAVLGGIAAGPRGALMFLMICAILIGCHQFGLRPPPDRG